MADITPRCMWKANWLHSQPDIELVPIERRTEYSVWVAGDGGHAKKEPRYTRWSAIEDSFDKARAAMVHALELEERTAEIALHQARGKLGNVTGKLRMAQALRSYALSQDIPVAGGDA